MSTGGTLLHVTFCGLLKPPTTDTLNLLRDQGKSVAVFQQAEELVGRRMLAIYASEGVYWANFDNEDDLLVWNQAAH